MKFFLVWWNSYRSYATEHKTKMPEGFIDGDLVERFLDLPQTQMEDVCKGIKVEFFLKVARLEGGKGELEK